MVFKVAPRAARAQAMRSPGTTPTIDPEQSSNAATHREEFPMDMKSDVDPQETREWLDAIDGVLDHEGADRAHFLIEQLIDKSRRRGRVRAVLGQHRLHQHDPCRAAAAYAWRPDDRGEDPPLRALERDGDGGAREQAHQRRRPHRQLSPRRRRSTTSASTTSGTRLRLPTAATWCSSRATRRPASTRARSCSAASPRSRWTTSARRSTARASRPIRTRG